MLAVQNMMSIIKVNAVMAVFWLFKQWWLLIPKDNLMFQNVVFFFLSLTCTRPLSLSSLRVSYVQAHCFHRRGDSAHPDAPGAPGVPGVPSVPGVPGVPA